MTRPDTSGLSENLTRGERFNLRDGHRTVTFVGYKLAEANSQSGTDTRWTELTVYQTITGKFVLEKIGRSDIMHNPTCPRSGKAKTYTNINEAFRDKGFAEEDGDSPETVFVACEVCNPNLEMTPIAVERDIFSVGTHETADQLVAQLHKKDETSGSTFLSRVARSLLEAAARVNDDIATSYNRPSDIT